MAETVLILSVFYQIYAFALYPALVYIFGRFINRVPSMDNSYKPDVTVIISVYNEEELIEGCIESIYNSDYPHEKLNVIIGSDGSDDSTNEICRGLEQRYKNLRFIELDRGGKNLALNKLTPEAKTELIFFLDADCRVSSDSISSLASIMADDQVGSVLAKIKIMGEKGTDAGEIGESVYQKFEAFIRKWESRIFTSINSLGTLYCIRRSEYSPIPNDLVCDDLFRLMYVSKLKKRIIYDESTTIYEIRKKSIGNELQRRIRLVAGGLSTIHYFKRLLLPDYGWISYFIWSHKVIRWFIPIPLVSALISGFFISNDYIRMVFLILFLLLVLSVILGYIFEKFRINFFPFKLAFFYYMMNIAFLMGIGRYFSGKQNSIWDQQGLTKTANE
ncbi:MAG: glycosyltransferase [Candidatus Kapaibacterium sp.]